MTQPKGTMTMRHFTSRGIALALLLSAGTSLAHAAGYPEKPVRLIVPTAPGGSIDTTARVIGEKLQAAWGKPIIIENRPGASMRLGAEAVQKSSPDGYTLLVAHDGTMATNPLMFSDLPYDPEKDFAPLGLIITMPEALMVNASVPAKSVAELIALAKKEPGRFTHASGGSVTLLSGALFKAMAGLDIRNIPYRGGAPAVTATIGGETDMCIADIVTSNAAMQSDRIRPLGITSKTRAKKYPDLPTLDESGVPGYEVNNWIGFFAPAGTPKEITTTVESAIKAAVAMPDVRARFEAIGAHVRNGTADELREMLASDLRKWAKLVKEQDIKLAP